MRPRADVSARWRTAAMARWMAAPLLALVAVGAAHGSEGQRQAGAHVHGEGRLDVAIAGGLARVALTAPGSDVVGFEHAPHTDTERAAVAAARARLAATTTLFDFGPAACTVTGTELALPDAAGGPFAVTDHGGHGDVHAVYDFACAEPERLERLTLGLFDAFPSLRVLHVQVATERGQGWVRAGPTAAAVDLRSPE